MKRCFVLFMCLFTFTFANAQSLKVTGIVTDAADNSVLPGAAVVIKNSSTGTTTDENGRFEISVAKGATLEFTYIGMEKQEFLITDGIDLTVKLNPVTNDLNEVVVVGYGTSRKRDLTGSIVSVKGEDIQNNPSTSPVAALQGKVAGVSIVNAGNAGGTPQVSIRGVGSLSASSPTYIVDGMFTDNIDFVNPNDIASMEVLKDASSLSMFGVKGANGVIIITTKSGKAGKIQINLDAYTGFQKIMGGDKLSLTNGEDFTKLYNEVRSYSKADYLAANPDAILDNSWNTFVPQIAGKGTDWLDEVTRTAPMHSIALSLSNSTEKSRSYFSLGYFKQDGVVKYDNYERYTARFNNEYNLRKWGKISGNAALSYWGKKSNSFVNYGDILSSAIKAMPTYLPYVPGTGQFMMPDRIVQGNISNPVAMMETGKYDNKSYGYRGVGNIGLELYLLKNLTYKGSVGADIGISQNKTYKEKYHYDSHYYNEKSSLSRATDEYRKIQTENYLTFADRFGEHDVKLMGGVTSYFQGWEGFSAGRDSIGSADRVGDRFQMLGQGALGTMSNGDGKNETAQLSFIARLNYSFKDRYILTATFRADGSSRFAPENRWGYFPSVGAAWVISDESFMKGINGVDFLKVKASWGQLGNDQPVGYYAFRQFVNPNGSNVIFGDNIITIPTINNMADPYLRWEKMSGTEVGVEASFLERKLSTQFNFFNRETSDFLTRIPVNSSVGVGYMATNGGSMYNRGIEMNIDWTSSVAGVNYSVGANFSYMKNKVTKLASGGKDIFDGPCITREGESVASFYGYKTDGIFQNQGDIDAYVNDRGEKIQPNAKPGDFRFKDVNGDGRFSDKDRTIIGKSYVPFTFGLNFRADYKGFDLGLDFDGVAGNDIFNAKLSPFGINQANFLSDWNNRWHGENTSNTMPVLSNQRPQNFENSDFYIESGAFFRLRNVQLGYTLPQRALSFLGIDKFRVYAAAQNLFTASKFNGWTPQIGGSPLQAGVDSGNLYPVPATMTVGVNLTF